jgi:hypothetical protein
MTDRYEPVGRNEGELGTLRSVIDGLWVHGERLALVAVGEEGVEIWTYGELAGRARPSAIRLHVSSAVSRRWSRSTPPRGPLEPGLRGRGAQARTEPGLVRRR